MDGRHASEQNHSFSFRELNKRGREGGREGGRE